MRREKDWGDVALSSALAPLSMHCWRTQLEVALVAAAALHVQYMICFESRRYFTLTAPRINMSSPSKAEWEEIRLRVGQQQ
jgi:hypothetical protein